MVYSRWTFRQAPMIYRSFQRVKTEPVVLDLPGTMLEANTNYFVAAVGTLASPSVQVAATSQAAMMDSAMTDDTMGNTIVDLAAADGRFTTLVAAVQAAGLVDTLAGEGPFTVFAPTDDAFAALPAGTVEGLLNDIPALTKVLLYHVVSGTGDGGGCRESDQRDNLRRIGHRHLCERRGSVPERHREGDHHRH